jgi:hypothetical protein
MILPLIFLLVSVSAESNNKIYIETFRPPFPVQMVLLHPMTEAR